MHRGGQLTKFGWFIMSPGQEFDKSVMLLTQTTQSNYEELCKLDKKSSRL